MADTVLNIIQGETVNFTDASIGDITGYSWEFPGGAPTGGTAQNPSVYYANIGEFDVNLTTEDSYGVINSISKSKIINVKAAPWGVSFEINYVSGSSALFGENISFTNTSIGSPNYVEWTFPSDGVTLSPATGPTKFDLGPVRYLNWETLTGSHAGLPGSSYTGTVNLYQTSPFALGTSTDKFNIKKLGPLEEYYESYYYFPSLGNFLDAGGKFSSVYGSYANSTPGAAAGATSAGLTYSFATGAAPGGVVFDWELPYIEADRESYYRVNFKSGFPGDFYPGVTGPTGLYYPHVHGEKASIYGRAFPAFNVIDSTYYAEDAGHTNELGKIGAVTYPNIREGDYTSPIIDPPVIFPEVANPEYAMVKANTFDFSLSDFNKSLLSLYTIPGPVGFFGGGGGSCLIPKPTIDKLLENPAGLPGASGGGIAFDDPVPVIGISTSADAHIGSIPTVPLNTFARSYFNTTPYSASQIGTYGTGPSDIGRYPCIPSQWALDSTSTPANITNFWNPSGVAGSTVPPLILEMQTYYRSDPGNPSITYISFGTPDPAITSLLGSFYQPTQRLDPLGPYGGAFGPTGYAQAYGNDGPKGGWILPQDTQYGFGVASYMNWHIDDPVFGIPGGTGDVRVVVDDYYTLPSPYSDNSPGSITNGGGGSISSQPGIAVQVLNPEILMVQFREIYGSFTAPAGPPIYALVPTQLKETPMTWDYGTAVPTGYVPNYPDYMDDAALDATPSTWLGISSRIVPFSYGVLGYGYQMDYGAPGELFVIPEDWKAGLKIGGDL